MEREGGRRGGAGALAAADAADPAIWIARVDRDRLMAEAAALDARGPAGLPLFGAPFAVKDNLDVAGLPTTAACPAFAFTPERSATAVERLVAAGAFVVGKTNLDQFATGLVGVRSPYGAPRSPFDSRYVSGGSSSGSAVAVARGLVSFALGSDTAGSGRVPAAFCNLIGLKPSRGLISAAGLVPACQSLDCVSIFATNADDAAAVLAAAAGFDPADPYSRAPTTPPTGPLAAPPSRFRFGVPRPQDLRFFGDGEVEALFKRAAERLTRPGRAADRDRPHAVFRGRQAALRGTVDRRAHRRRRRLPRRPPGRRRRDGRSPDRQGRRVRRPSRLRRAAPARDLRRDTETAWSAIDVLLTPTAPTA